MEAHVGSPGDGRTPAARRRTLERRWRASFLLAWKSRRRLLLAAPAVVAGWLDWAPLGDWGTSVVLVVAAFVLVVPLELLLERWHRRAGR